LRSDRTESTAVGFFEESLWTALAARFRLTIASFRDAKKLTGAAPVTFNRPRKGGWNHAKIPLCGPTLVTMMESGDFPHRNNSPHVRRLDRARFRPFDSRTHHDRNESEFNIGVSCASIASEKFCY